MTELSMTFWPNPVYRNHTGEMRWYFNVALRAAGALQVQLHGYRGEWYDLQDRLQETKEAGLDILLVPRQPLSYPDLWVTSALARFQYRLIIHGRDADGRDVSAEAVLACR